MFLKFALISLWSHCDSGCGKLRSLWEVDIHIGQSQNKVLTQQNENQIFRDLLCDLETKTVGLNS